ncbi:MAG TPA: hypothetical protein VFR90_08870 [Methylibium sp.]|uniref:hypothetical protein n=1 Tax=Methylibium sp. TaxID=2067992 RepID=UPI002DB57F94|nr:hypothetical protein [Methylibium sp.]HEU4459219.1 hypothetical protein [Methylibium sp.]
MTLLRRWLNRIDRRLDGAALHAPLAFSEKLPGGGVPALASHALERAVSEARKHDPDARLKHVLAPAGVAADGAASRWEFVFDLPSRRAKLLAQWYLDGDTRHGRFGRECLDASVKPFPLPDSPIARGVAEGRMPYSTLAAAWREERRRTPDLSLSMRDSDAVMSDLQRQGLAAGSRFVLRNALNATGAAIWLAQADGLTLHCRFA